MRTRFMDMHSGGSKKTAFEYIYIEAPEKEAIEIFEQTFNQRPLNVACECFGENFSVSTDETLKE